MSDKTTYLVETEYKVKDEASHGLEKIGHAAEEAHEHAESLRGVLKEVGETFLVFEGVEKAKELFVGFNAELQTSKIQLQAALGVGFKKSWEVAGGAANEFYEDYEKFAEEFPASMNEMAQNAKDLGSAVAHAGGSMEDLKIMSERATIAQKALGMSSGELRMAMSGLIRAQSSGGMALLNAVGMDREQWRKLSDSSRLALTKKFLESETLTKAGDAISGSFAGQASILKDRLEVAAGKVGLPLFKALNEELKHWNEWLEKNSAKISEISGKIASGLVTGFGYLKSVGEFLYDHSSVLIKIAEAWAAVKIGGAIGQIGGLLGGKLSGLGGIFGAEGRLATAEGFMGKAGAGLGAIGVAAPFAAAAGQILGESLGNAVYPGVRRLKEMEASVHKLDEALAEGVAAAKEFSGAMSSHAAGLAAGVIRSDQEKLETLERIQASKGDKSISNQLNWRWKQKEALQSGGFDPHEIDQLLGNEQAREEMIRDLKSSVSLRGQKLGFTAGATDIGLKMVMSQMSKDQRAHLNVAKATEIIMREQLRMWSAEHRFLSPDEMKKIVLEDKSLQDEQAKINQTVNVTIQQVSAKDPDRWIADMDEYAARRVRARTKAKGALARGH